VASERLSSADVASVLAEEPSAPQHVGSLAILQASTAGGAPGLDYDRLVQLLEERISLVPRYRQKIRTIPGHIANPVWVDDPNFDITYHVRRSALPRPGGDAELLEFCARIQSRQLDRARPLWELYLIEGLSDDRVAIITKTHQAMIDDDGAVDIAHVLLDASPHPHRTVEALWMPEPEPSGKDLFVGAVAGLVRRPTALVDTVRLGAQDVRVTARRAGSLVAGVASAAAAVWRRVPESPLSARLSEQRRIAVARTRLDDYRLVRRAHDVTVNDVVLATIAGAIRS
jgi:WS/DGAT/MGAT family acyltransferase